MDEMTREEIDNAIGELDDAEREYLKLLISRVIRCFVDDDHEAVLLFGKEGTTQIAMCTVNCDEIPAANMINYAYNLTSFMATVDAPAKEKFN
jgi:hypothetical protein